MRNSLQRQQPHLSRHEQRPGLPSPLKLPYQRLRLPQTNDNDLEIPDIIFYTTRQYPAMLILRTLIQLLQNGHAKFTSTGPHPYSLADVLSILIALGVNPKGKFDLVHLPKAKLLSLRSGTLV